MISNMFHGEWFILLFLFIYYEQRIREEYYLNRTKNKWKCKKVFVKIRKVSLKGSNYGME